MEVTSTDKMTTYLATVKIIIGMLGIIALFFGKPMGPEVQEAFVGLASAGYLVFSWLQGFWTNKGLNKPVDGGTIVDIPDNKEETYAINERIEYARQKEGRDFMDPSEQLLSHRRIL